MMRLKFESRPSLAPSTDARSVFATPSRWRSLWREGVSAIDVRRCEHPAMCTLLRRYRSAFVTEPLVSRLCGALPGRQRGGEEARPKAASEKAEDSRSAGRNDVVDGSAECSEPLGTEGSMALLRLGQARVQAVACGVRGQRAVDVGAVHLVLPACPPERDLVFPRHSASLRRRERSSADEPHGSANFDGSSRSPSLSSGAYGPAPTRHFGRPASLNRSTLRPSGTRPEPGGPRAKSRDGRREVPVGGVRTPVSRTRASLGTT